VISRSTVDPLSQATKNGIQEMKRISGNNSLALGTQKEYTRVVQILAENIIGIRNDISVDVGGSYSREEAKLRGVVLAPDSRSVTNIVRGRGRT